MKTVLFACVHNAGRSQMAAAFFNQLADMWRSQAISAGTKPGEHVHPEVVETMKEVGIDVSGARPRSVTSVPLPSIDMLVTMGCGDDACPVAPGVKVEDWELDDPRGLPLDRVRAIRDEIKARVERLLEAQDWRR